MLTKDAILTCKYKGIIGILEIDTELLEQIVIAVVGEDRASNHNSFKDTVATYIKDNPSMKVTVIEANKYNSAVAVAVAVAVLDEVILQSKIYDGGIDHLRIEAHSDTKGITLKYKDQLLSGSAWNKIVFKPNAYIRFTGCNTGGTDGIKSKDSIAQKVANKTGKIVYGFVNNTSQKEENGRLFQYPVSMKDGQKVVYDYTEFIPEN